MKLLLRFVLYTVLLAPLTFATGQSSQFPEVTIRQILEVPDSILVEMEQLVEQGASTEQTAPMRHPPMLGDTVIVTGVVTVDAMTDDGNEPRVLIRGRPSVVVYIQDPDDASWAGIQLRDDSRDPDNPAIGGLASGLHEVKAGFKIRVTAVVEQYQPSSLSGETQLSILPGTTVEVLDDNWGTIAYTPKSVGDFMKGSGGGSDVRNNSMRFPTGEPYLGMKVSFEDVRVARRIKRTDGRWEWSVLDQDGNEMHILDASKYTRGGPGGADDPAVNPDWEPPPPNALLDIRGIMGTFPGYALIPITDDDIVVKGVPPVIESVTRSHVTPPPDVAFTVTAYVTHPADGMDVDSVVIHYKVNDGAYQQVRMVDTGNEIYEGSIPPQDDGDLVFYYIVAYSGDDMATMPPTGELRPYFYRVREGGKTLIQDTKFTPFFPAEYPAMLGQTVTVSGIVISDRSDISGYVHIQDGTEPWSGIWIYGPGVTGSEFQKGDEVTITGEVRIDNVFSRVPRIFVASTNDFQVIASGLALPEPLLFTASDFPAGRAADHPESEPWMGLLLRFEDLTIVNDNLGFSEFMVEDDTGQMRVAAAHSPSWTSTYSVNPQHNPTYLMRNGTTFDALQGIMFYSFNNYKLIPRNVGDFMGVTSVTDRVGDKIPLTFELFQNYPNPFNPTTQIRFSLPEESHVTLRIFNVLGQQVKVLVDENFAPGIYAVTFDASSLASGMYIYRIEAGNFVETKRMMFIK